VIRKCFALSAQEKMLQNFFLSLAIRVRERFQVQRNLPVVLVALQVVAPVAHCEKLGAHRILSSARYFIKYGGSMEIKEIALEELDADKFIAEKIEEISSTVGNGLAINALSGGVDSSVVTILGHKALGDRFKTYFIDNALMRAGEPQYIVSIFKDLGVTVELIDAEEIFFKALQDLTDPEEKREAITRSFYRDVFAQLVEETGARHLFHGTNYTDVEETVAGIKRQHNILEQLGIDPEKMYGYEVIEPLIQLRKSAIRKIAKVIGLPEELYSRPPFPGPALATRVIGEVTPERVTILRGATRIVEEELSNSGAFQYLAILHNDKVTGIRQGKRDYGLQIEVRCWESTDAKIGSPTRLSWDVLDRLAERLTTEVPGVVSVTYNITKKPPSTIEAI
jgi:GMP synthase (glutamine-hydrolysing)